MKIIQIDTRQQMNRKHHLIKEKYFECQGYKIVKSKMLVGDYCLPNNVNVVVDTKKDLSELYGNLIQDHERFRAECDLAKQCGIHLHVIVESAEGFRKLEDIKRWKNPQYYRWLKTKRLAGKMGKPIPKPPVSNVQLLKIMHSMSRDHGVTFEIVPQNECGKRILEILEAAR